MNNMYIHVPFPLLPHGLMDMVSGDEIQEVTASDKGIAMSTPQDLFSSCTYNIPL